MSNVSDWMMLEYSMDKNKPPVWFDADGVLFDFDLHYQNLLGPREPDEEADWERLYKDFPTFFADLPVMKGVYQLWDMVTPERRRILSAVAKRIDNCGELKRISLKKHFNIEGPNVVLVKGRKNKKLYCTPGAILVDDRQDNIDDWISVGGIGIKFDNMQQAIDDLGKVL